MLLLTKSKARKVDHCKGKSQVKPNLTHAKLSSYINLLGGKGSYLEIIFRNDWKMPYTQRSELQRRGSMVYGFTLLGQTGGRKLTITYWSYMYVKYAFGSIFYWEEKLEKSYSE